MNGKGHFIFVTNLAPCSGVRQHLWPQNGNLTSLQPAGRRLREVTLKMTEIPSRPAPGQVAFGLLFMFF